MSPLNGDVFPLYVAEITQALAERLDASRGKGRGGIIKVPYPRNFRWLLRP
jgi:hypothetical protein